jgi:hypothetical protein
MAQDVSGLVTTAPSGLFGNNADVTIQLGRSGEQLVTETHGKWYTANYGNKVFIAATAVAGTTIPVQATNLVSTFTLLNPLGSNVNLELIDYNLGVTNATTVVGDVSLYYQTGVGSSNAALTSTTSLTIRPAVLGGPGTSLANAYSAATFTNTVGTNFFRIYTLGSFGAVTTNNALPIHTEFDGKIIVGPGTAITVAGSAAQTQAMTQTISWVEWPV